jgi:hypothetical protein
MGSERCCPAKIMGDDKGTLELPVIKHLSKDLPLHIKGGALLIAFIGLTIAGHVVPMNPEMP